ncbi:hypothetical protein G6F42_011379 [Rhizopus arrhizus]|nr:hypothetical protein G6F42_011379 [Rhizopus arrhizus]
MEGSFYNRCPSSMAHAVKLKAEYIPYNLNGENLFKVIECMRPMVEETPESSASSIGSYHKTSKDKRKVL